MTPHSLLKARGRARLSAAAAGVKLPSLPQMASAIQTSGGTFERASPLPAYDARPGLLIRVGLRARKFLGLLGRCSQYPFFHAFF